MTEVAAPVVRELRLALLAPAELSALEEQNRREPLIPVRRREPGSESRSSVGWGWWLRVWGAGRATAGLHRE